MKITRISVYSAILPFKENASRGSRTVIVKMETDEGIVGLGEVCTINTHYMRGFAEGAIAGIPIIAKHVIGEDPFHYEPLNRKWDAVFSHDLYVKSPLDIALGDIMGQATGRPVCDLLGGRYEGQAPLHRSIYFPPEKQVTPEEVVCVCLEKREEGFRAFQQKVGRNPKVDIPAIEAVCDILNPDEILLLDANTRYTLTEAITVANAIRDLPVIMEQPCLTWEESIDFRRRCPLPVKLDELIETPQDIDRGNEAGAMDMIAVKVARVGGLTKARQMRDLAIDLGISVVPDDAWGSEIVSSSLLHFAASTDPKYLVCYTDLTDYVDFKTADGFPERDGPNILASDAPGLGQTLREEAVGEPIHVIS